VKRDLIAHLGTLDFVSAKDNVVFLGPPGTGKTQPRDRAGDTRPPSRTPGFCSPPPPTRSPTLPMPTTPAGCKPNSSGSGVTRCW
jgi:IstB-like ATP binding protein